MKNLSVSQSYLMCSLNEKGKLPVLNTEIPVCLLAGGMIDLLLANTVSIDADKKIHIINDLTDKNQYLHSLYTFVVEKKSMTVEKLASEYAFSFSDKQMKLLIKDVGESLTHLGYASAHDGGRMNKTPLFIPDKEIVDNIIQNMKEELSEKETLSDSVIALVCLMNKSNQIKKYFSKYERNQLKICLQEMKNTNYNKLIQNMVDYIDVLVSVVASTGIVH